MSKLSMWRRYARIHGSDPRRDVDDEFTFHLEERIEALVARGLSPEAARAEALLKFGDLVCARGECTAIGARRSVRARITEHAESLAQDVAHTLRGFRRAPGFVAAVVLTTALGIGANVAVFTILNALLLRPLPVARPHELARVYTSDATMHGATGLFGGSSFLDYRDLRGTPAFRDLVVYMPLAVNVRRGALTTRAEGQLVSENFFGALGIRAAAGRLIASGDSAQATDPPVVLDYRFWVRAFAADSGLIGSSIQLNGRSVTIVGVAAPEFLGLEPSQIDLYVPVSGQPAMSPGFDLLTERGARLMKIVGRLAPGVSVERAERDLNTVMRALGREYPQTNAGRQIAVRSATSMIDLPSTGAPVAPLVGLLFGVTGVVLIMAAVNVAGLLLARTVSRRRELAVRLSLGASRRRILRQLVTESLVLAFVAEGVAVLAVSTMPFIARVVGVPASVDLHVDGRVFLFASGITLLAALASGLGPALRGASRDVFGALRESESSARPARARAQRALVVVQVGLSIVLLVTAALLIQSLQRQREVRPGFETSRLLVADFEGVTGFQTPEQERSFVATTVGRARELPGVVAASVATTAPLTSEGFRMTIAIPGYQPANGESMEIPALFAGGDYFRVLGLRIVRGAELGGNVADTLSRVVINETMARRYWAGRDPVGTTVYLGGAGGTPAQVIAVAADARLRSLSQPPASQYVVQRTGGGSTLLLRTASAPTDLMPAVRRVLGESNAAFVLRRLRPMDEIVRASLASAAALAGAVAAVSAVALALAIFGLYSVVSYIAAQRTREFGIRMALGASASDVLRLVLFSGIRLAIVGGVGGLVVSLGASAALHGFLFSVEAAEIPTLAVVAAIMGVVAILACLVPAIRATTASPVDTLRAD